MTGNYRGGLSLWNEEDGFFYDALHLPDGRVIPLKVRSLVGLMPLLAVETLEHDLVESLPVFKRRMNWFFKNRIYLRDSGNVACVQAPGAACAAAAVDRQSRTSGTVAGAHAG